MVSTSGSDVGSVSDAVESTIAFGSNGSSDCCAKSSGGHAHGDALEHAATSHSSLSLTRKS